MTPPRRLGRTGAESAHRMGLLTWETSVRLGNYCDQHGKQWLQEGVKVLCVCDNVVRDD